MQHIFDAYGLTVTCLPAKKQPCKHMCPTCQTPMSASTDGQLLKAIACHVRYRHSLLLKQVNE